MKTYIEPRTLYNQTITAILSFITIGILGSFVESFIGTNFRWGLCLGLALSYPYDFTEQTTRYLLKIASLAAMTMLELTTIQKTGIIDRILYIYRTQYIDNQLI